MPTEGSSSLKKDCIERGEREEGGRNGEREREREREKGKREVEKGKEG